MNMKFLDMSLPVEEVTLKGFANGSKTGQEWYVDTLDWELDIIARFEHDGFPHAVVFELEWSAIEPEHDSNMNRFSYDYKGDIEDERGTQAFVNFGPGGEPITSFSLLIERRDDHLDIRWSGICDPGWSAKHSVDVPFSIDASVQLSNVTIIVPDYVTRDGLSTIIDSRYTITSRAEFFA